MFEVKNAMVSARQTKSFEGINATSAVSLNSVVDATLKSFLNYVTSQISSTILIRQKDNSPSEATLCRTIKIV